MSPASPTSLAIRAEDLCKHYALGHGQPPKKAIDGVTFRIGEGERVGFIGRNGAGKTTLLQMLAGIAEPSGGILHVDGKVTAIFTLGMGLREDLTGLENIFVEGELMGRTREQTQALVDEIVAFAELGAFIDRPVRTYSTGMKARLAFSTIVHIEPEILIIDEALSVGDVKFGAKATAKMRELTRKGRILIVVSHSMGAIEDMCSRCLWIDEGRIRLDGPPSEVTRAYLDEVRRADEAKLSERFRHQLVNESLLPGWSIDAAEMQSAEGLVVQHVVTGDSCAFSARVRAPAGEGFQAVLGLHRLDGLAVLETTCRFDGQSAAMCASGERRLHLDFGRLPLNYGLYKAQLEIRTDAGPAARRAVLFEVVNPRPPRGGRPVLVYPSTLTVTKTS
ncbi:polysaccharide ABC transporter ATP-binding protein [Ramlibacter rhizophilus]|uniref:ATP-binding cassette domain-containing protein n=1 Tax=Ramlibacter rhizophilus TaxID=1781167 RepID=A0A4Z0BMN6_9BURK|nr:polysaccharide ABC transporter ATP-binding protein [Ramlibacter rhizophilus]TFY99673.1 ATP-binding cassette domain-containing protein [Ramlibacter rhizophilus]